MIRLYLLAMVNITISDVSFNASDVLKVDVGVANLNRYFFYANLADASTLDDENAVDENSIYNVIWTNSDSATIDFSNSQTDEVLFSRIQTRKVISFHSVEISMTQFMLARMTRFMAGIRQII